MALPRRLAQAAAAVAGVRCAAPVQAKEKPASVESSATAPSVVKKQGGCIQAKPAKVPHISEWIKTKYRYPNPLIKAKLCEVVSFDPPEVILQNIQCSEGIVAEIPTFIRAGPVAELFWDPGEVRACIVTCGGLSPGLNNVIRGVVTTLSHYGVPSCYGIPFGYKGFYVGDYQELTYKGVSLAHHQGGTIIGSSRGGFDQDKILDAVEARGINQVYIVGGDGTHRGAQKLHEEARRRGSKVAIIGIPKTIDNDIGIIDRSFGFKTCIELARRTIECARVEAASAPNGICVVKLMGRDSGFIATHATLSSRDVDLCLTPEVPVITEGEKSVFRHLRHVVRTKGHAVVVVAEGACQEQLSATERKDPSGNKVYADVGAWLKNQITDNFKDHNLECNVRYIDPSYIIRSVPANADDSEYCMLLAQAAVHGAMAGYSAFSAGLVNNRTVLIPITMIGETSPRKQNIGRVWGRVVEATGQPF